MISAENASSQIATASSVSVQRLGGWLSTIGAAGLVITNIFYALGLAATPAPLQPYDLDAAINGAIAAAPMMKAAGMVGVIGDLIWATAALMLAQEFGRQGKALASAGWNVLVLAVILFIFVDGITGFVIPQLAASHDLPAFEGYRRFWDILFLLCVLAFATATMTIGADYFRASNSTMSRLHAAAMLLAAAVGGVTSATGFVAILGGELPSYALPGASIGIGSALFLPLSVQIALGRANWCVGPRFVEDPV